MELFDALRARTSVRSYLSKVPDNDIQVDLLNYLNNVPVLLPEADISIELLAYEDLFDYFPVEANQMVKAPLYLAFRGSLDLYQIMNVGYYAQHAAIWLTGRGLGSVWQSGFKIRKLQEDEIMEDINSANWDILDNASEEEKTIIPAVLALGYPKKKAKKPVRKKKLKQILLTDVKELNNNVLSLLEAARLAPSEYNAQPWYYAVEDNKLIHVFIKEPQMFNFPQRQNMRQLAMGCALGNMEIMAALRGIRLEYGFVDDLTDYGQSSKNLYYLGTILMEKVYKQMMFGIDY